MSWSKCRDKIQMSKCKYGIICSQVEGIFCSQVEGIFRSQVDGNFCSQVDKSFCFKLTRVFACQLERKLKAGYNVCKALGEVIKIGKNLAIIFFDKVLFFEKCERF